MNWGYFALCAYIVAVVMVGALSLSEHGPRRPNRRSHRTSSLMHRYDSFCQAASRPQGRSMCVGMRTLLLILYCTGLRFGEAVRLRMGDVDLEKRVIFVRESKGKSRLVPFGADLGHELHEVICAIARTLHKPRRSGYRHFVSSRKWPADDIGRLRRRLSDGYFAGGVETQRAAISAHVHTT